MATYQISFFALGPDGATGAFAVPEPKGLRFALASVDVGAVLVEDGPGGPDDPVVAPDSPLGRAGQAVELGLQITAISDEAGPRMLRFHVLKLDGVAVGLIGADVPPSGVWLLVTGTEPPGDPATLRSLADDSLPQPVSSRPRKTLFAFTPGTRIDTPQGARLVEDLAPGDLVSTLDNGSQPVRWVGSRWVSPAEMQLREDLRPVHLDAGAFGNPAPLVVSPRHRILLNDWRAQVYFGEDEVLIPAQALINGASVRQILPDSGVTYIHLLFDRHEVIIAEGTLSESFHPGETGLGALDTAQRQEIGALFPGQALERRRAAFAIVRMAEARALRLPG
ncbi:Hint domain-containing protein [Tabrizicola piscis]|uniref:Hint domain-containing protein n=1 Tax=Tabrizicola piscis TaxID=2494374 RepID=A0A3S8U907_9RHOB|nr:Hint domain-containing protein [Tabrizicola piscis]AZL60084.1 Hint domain-containing protein [Tabrizicola piscis]